MSAEDSQSEIPSEDHSEVIKQLSDAVFRSGLLLIDGTLKLTKSDISFYARPTPSKDKKKTNDDAEEKGAVAEQLVLSIPLQSIESMTYEFVLGKPSLSLKWKDNTKSFGRSNKSQFIQNGIASRDDRIATWIAVIDREAFYRDSAPASESDALKVKKHVDMGKERTDILDVLNQKDWKGLFQVVAELKQKKGADYDFDEVEEMCQKLVAEKLLVEDKVGGFFKKA